MTAPSTILGIDPGTNVSGWVRLNGSVVEACGVDDNELVAEVVRNEPRTDVWVVIERIEPRYGLRMGWETIAACEWVGRFTEAADGMPVALLTRSVVLAHLHVSAKAAEPGTRAAMLDRWGGAAAARKGGPLYGVKTHIWSALGVAVAWREGAKASLLRAPEA